MFYTNDFSVLCNGFINRYSKPIANWWRYWSNEYAYNHNRSDFRGNNSSDSRGHCMFPEEKEIIPTIFQQRRWVSKPHLHGPKKWGIFRSSCWGVWPDSGRQGNYFLIRILWGSNLEVFLTSCHVYTFQMVKKIFFIILYDYIIIQKFMWKVLLSVLSFF